MLSRFKKLEAKHLLDTKRKRGYWCISSGMAKAEKLGIPLYRLDLTLKGTSEITRRKVNQWKQTLQKRIQRHYRKRLVYVTVKARGDLGGKTHLHLVYWVQTLNGKPIFELSKAWINKHWLSWNWREITSGSKITYIKVVKGGLVSRKRVGNYFVRQYFSGQNQYERMSYSRDWLFKGASTIWKTEFAPSYYGDKKQSTLDSWVGLLCFHAILSSTPNG